VSGRVVGHSFSEWSVIHSLSGRYRMRLTANGVGNVWHKMEVSEWAGSGRVVVWLVSE